MDLELMQNIDGDARLDTKIFQVTQEVQFKHVLDD